MGARIGLLGIGLHTYWPQFPHLKERLEGYQALVARRLADLGADVVDAKLVDSPESASAAAALFTQNNVEAIFLYVATYALSHIVLPLALRVGRPVVILNLQPVKQLDYTRFNALGDRGLMTGEWLANCQACSVPEIANVFNVSAVRYDIITGWLDDNTSWQKIAEWLAAIAAKKAVRDARIGIVGHYYAGMLDVYTDLTRLVAVFGSHFELLEMDFLYQLSQGVREDEIDRKLVQFNNEFDVSNECTQKELVRAARTSCALDRLVDAKKLDAVAYYYEGCSGNAHEDLVTSLIAGTTLLTAHHVPVAGECEVKNALAMKIMDVLGAGGSFSEFYAMDFEDDVVLLGHDGPAHAGMAADRVQLVPLSVYHGKPGQGLSIQMRVRLGPVTLLSVVQGAQGGTFFLVAQAEAVEGPTLHIGNTNSRYRFPLPAREFVDAWCKAGPAHHCAVGTGHIASTIEKLAVLLGIQCRRIC